MESVIDLGTTFNAMRSKQQRRNKLYSVRAMMEQNSSGIDQASWNRDMEQLCKELGGEIPWVYYSESLYL